VYAITQLTLFHLGPILFRIMDPIRTMGGGVESGLLRCSRCNRRRRRMWTTSRPRRSGMM
jgi:hypothetical protein